RRKSGRTAEALDDFRQGWNCEPPAMAAGLALSGWDVDQGRPTAAAERLAVCVGRRPENRAARIAYAQVLESLGRETEAAAQRRWLADRGESGGEAFDQLAKEREGAGGAWVGGKVARASGTTPAPGRPQGGATAAEERWREQYPPLPGRSLYRAMD
ncbi:MAG: hypothetical protein ACRDD1_20155, partial [Planctomycetia bacterium]